MTASPASEKARAILGSEELRMVSAYAQQSRLMPFDYAEQVTHLPAALLRKLVRDGVVPGEAPFRVQGLVGYCDIEVAQRIAEELKAARAGLEG